jgi:hypothetical protein
MLLHLSDLNRNIQCIFECKNQIYALKIGNFNSSYIAVQIKNYQLNAGTLGVTKEVLRW